MVSFRREGAGIQLRIHHLFLGAPPEVVAALADFARPGRRAGRQEASRRIDGWIRTHRDRIAPPRTGRLHARGRVHDLQAILDRLNADLVKSLATPEVKTGLLKVGMNAVSTTPEQFSQYIRDEIVKWTKVAKAANIKLE